jgi:uncharacterized repeat protein (TIGR03847 family)
MPNTEIELNPVDFITVGTIGPKGQRIFHLQAGKDEQLVSLIIEKEQAWALSEALRELIDDLEKRYPETSGTTPLDLSKMDMDLREPIEPLFRVAQMGLGYDEERSMVVLVAQELVALDEDADPDLVNPGIVRMWGNRAQMRALSNYTMEIVQQGRADPKMNGRLVYYWI